MDKIFIVTITYFVHMHGFYDIRRTDAKVFTSKDKAENYLMDSGFVYGKNNIFTKAGWYHFKMTKHPNFRVYDIFDYIVAKVEEVEVDQSVKYPGITFFNAFGNGEKI